MANENKEPVKAKSDGLIDVTVLKAGDGKISTGERKNAQDVKFKRGAKLRLEAEQVVALEARGYVETVD